MSLKSRLSARIMYFILRYSNDYDTLKHLFHFYVQDIELFAEFGGLYITYYNYL